MKNKKIIGEVLEEVNWDWDKWLKINNFTLIQSKNDIFTFGANKSFNIDEAKKEIRKALTNLTEKKDNEFLKLVEDMIRKNNEDLVLWRHNLGRDGRKLGRKGYFKNPDFNLIALGKEGAFKELKSKLKGK